MTYFAEQMETIDVRIFHHRVTFRPEQIIPAIDLRTSGNDGE